MTEAAIVNPPPGSGTLRGDGSFRERRSLVRRLCRLLRPPPSCQLDSGNLV
jgi:hypothetical protein